MMNQVVAGPETFSYHLTYYLYLSQGPGYDEPGWWLDQKPTPTTEPTICTCLRGPDMMNQVVAGPESYSYH